MSSLKKNKRKDNKARTHKIWSEGSRDISPKIIIDGILQAKMSRSYAELVITFPSSQQKPLEDKAQ